MGDSIRSHETPFKYLDVDETTWGSLFHPFRNVNVDVVVDLDFFTVGILGPYGESQG